jgi:poly(3-hydroxybutyrate) depolymerase
VLLFPQVAPHPLRNPIGCWDFWGYSGPDYATKQGAQMRAVIAMLDRLQAPAR